MAVNKEKKSFKKFARKHLANVIQTRRKTAKAKKEKTERLERRTARNAKNAAAEEKEHVEQLERLKETDPEFFSYLEEEDPTLLQFGQENVNVFDDDIGSDAETEEDEDEDEQGANEETSEELNNNEDEKSEKSRKENAEGMNDDINKKEETSKIDMHKRIDKEEIDALLAGKNVEKVIDVFICATRELGYKVKERERISTTRKFADPTIVKDVLLTTFQFVSSNVSELVSGKGAFKSFKTRYLVKRVLLTIISLFTSAEEALSSNSTDATLLTGLLHSVVPFVPLLHYVKGATKGVLKSALHLCAVDDENVHLAAYVVVRAIATRATGTRSMYQSAAFKGIFLTLVKASHQFNVQNQQIIAFMINCVVDLYGTDIEAAYQHTFVYLRQLAIYLRAALQQQSQSNVRAVVNWQYINALRTWGAVVSTYCEPAQLGPLIYPLVQITITLLDVFSSPRMFPMHLLLIEILNHVSIRANCLYIPVAPYLLRIITSPSIVNTLRHGKSILVNNVKNQNKIELSRKYERESSSSDSNRTSANTKKQMQEAEKYEQYKVSTTNTISLQESENDVQLPFTIRVKKSQSRSSTYHLSLSQQAVYLLTEHLSTHSNNIGFPETFWSVESTLKKFNSEIKIPRLHNNVQNLLQRYKETIVEIMRRRSDVAFGPCDMNAVKEFEDVLKSNGNPLQKHYENLRKERIQLYVAKHSNTNEQRKTLNSIVASQSNRKRKRTVYT